MEREAERKLRSEINGLRRRIKRLKARRAEIEARRTANAVRKRRFLSRLDAEIRKAETDLAVAEANYEGMTGVTEE